MAVTKTVYLERFLDAVDRVEAGQRGGISDDRWLVNNYNGEMLHLVDKYLDHTDDEVRAEVILLFSDVRERAVIGKIREMSRKDSDKVRMAASGYLSSVQDDDELIPQLFDILEHRNGAEFRKAAMRMASIAREGDIPRIRKIYGQVKGEMHTDMRVVLDKVIARNPHLQPKRDLIMSVPVYPDEAAFDKFLDSAIEYIDVRYREKIHPISRVPRVTYNNVVRALNKIRIRLYNEADNLDYYGADKIDRHSELTSLLSWATSDLTGKEVEGSGEQRSKVCPRCGEMMVLYNGIWMCPDCGGI